MENPRCGAGRIAPSGREGSSPKVAGSPAPHRGGRARSRTGIRSHSRACHQQPLVRESAGRGRRLNERTDPRAHSDICKESFAKNYLAKIFIVVYVRPDFLTAKQDLFMECVVGAHVSGDNLSGRERELNYIISRKS